MLTTCPPEDIATVIFLALPTQLDLCDLPRGKMWKPGARRELDAQGAGGDCLRNTLEVTTVSKSAYLCPLKCLGDRIAKGDQAALRV